MSAPDSAKPSPFPSLLRLAIAGIALIGGLQTPSSAQSTRPAGRSGSAPVVSALDLNKDGKIDASEIAKSGQSLAALDKNGDGTLTPDEYRRGAAVPQPVSQQPAAPLPSPAPVPLPKDAAARPNILIIVADDLGWNGVGFHSASATTPNLDRLAGEGMELRRFYTYPVCSPTRAALLTGKSPLRFNIADALPPTHPGIPAGIPTLPEAFRAAGYQTSLIGKWHIGSGRLPSQCGFDHFYGFLGPQIDYFQHTGPRGTPDWQRDGKAITETGYSTDLLADETVRQIANHDKARPFFIELAFNAPHVPLAAPDDLTKKYGTDDAGLYQAVIEGLDLAIGKVLASIDAQGLRDRTLVVFFSDNGAGRRFSDSAPFKSGKDTVYEGGIHTPCVLRWPGRLPAGSKNDHPVSVQDLFPTLTAAAGLTTDPSACDGSNQWPSIASGKTAARDPILIASHDSALIDGTWKLIAWENGATSLHDLAKDPGENTDLSKAAPETATRLKAALDKLRRDLPPAPAKQPKPGTRRN